MPLAPLVVDAASSGAEDLASKGVSNVVQQGAQEHLGSNNTDSSSGGGSNPLASAISAMLPEV